MIQGRWPSDLPEISPPTGVGSSAGSASGSPPGWPHAVLAAAAPAQPVVQHRRRDRRHPGHAAGDVPPGATFARGGVHRGRLRSAWPYVAKDQAWAVALVVAAGLFWVVPAPGDRPAGGAGGVGGGAGPESTDFTSDFVDPPGPGGDRHRRRHGGCRPCCSRRGPIGPPSRAGRRKTGTWFHLLGVGHRDARWPTRRADAVRQARIDGGPGWPRTTTCGTTPWPSTRRTACSGSHWR